MSNGFWVVGTNVDGERYGVDDPYEISIDIRQTWTSAANGVEMRVEPKDGVGTVDVLAFSPDEAITLAKHILEAAGCHAVSYCVQDMCPSLDPAHLIEMRTEDLHNALGAWTGDSQVGEDIRREIRLRENAS